MSIEALRWALDIGEELDLEPARRLVLIMLGNSADHTGGNLFPSHGYISKRTGLANSTVRAHVAALGKSGLLLKEPRRREDGSQTSNTYRLALRQPGLPLIDDERSQRHVTPLPESSRGGARASRAPARQPAGGVPAAGTLDTQEETQEEKKRAGRAEPSPVARCFKAYQDGMQAKYGGTYPPSGAANGKLAQVVKRVGAEHAEGVVRAFLASQNPYYGKIKHRLDALVKDCEQLYMDLQRSSGTAPAKAPTTAKVALLADDGRVMRLLDDVPAGEMSRIAETALKNYSQMIAKIEPKYIAVRQGTERRQYSIEELLQARSAHA